MPIQLRPVRVGFVVDKFALGDVFIRVLKISSVSIIPPLLHTLLRHVAFSRNPNGRSLITVEKATHFANRGARDRKVPSLSSSLKGQGPQMTTGCANSMRFSIKAAPFLFHRYLKTSSGLYFSSRLASARASFPEIKMLGWADLKSTVFLEQWVLFLEE